MIVTREDIVTSLKGVEDKTVYASKWQREEEVLRGIVSLKTFERLITEGTITTKGILTDEAMEENIFYIKEAVKKLGGSKIEQSIIVRLKDNMPYVMTLTPYELFDRRRSLTESLAKINKEAAGDED
jgi:hypothetical protein